MEENIFMLDKLRITKDDINTFTVTILSDELSSRNSDKIKDIIIYIIEEGATKIIFNLSKVKIMDSSGIGVLIDISRKLKPKGNIVLSEVQPEILIHDFLF